MCIVGPRGASRRPILLCCVIYPLTCVGCGWWGLDDILIVCLRKERRVQAGFRTGSGQRFSKVGGAYGRVQYSCGIVFMRSGEFVRGREGYILLVCYI